jgi:hypothetical protein
MMLCPADSDSVEVSDMLFLTGAARTAPHGNEPKNLVIVPGGSVDPYVEGFDVAAPAVVDWFTQHLRAGVPG